MACNGDLRTRLPDSHYCLVARLLDVGSVLDSSRRVLWYILESAARLMPVSLDIVTMHSLLSTYFKLGRISSVHCRILLNATLVVCIT